jgi:uncharacterized protein YecE (DUF72 family)
LRHAIEVRHASFRCPAFVELLRAHEVALVCSDAPTWPRMMDLTADFAYCRLQGPKEPQVSSYDSAALDTWVARCRAWANGAEPEDGERVAGKGRARKRDVFIIFDNHSRIRAPASATELIRRLRM